MALLRSASIVPFYLLIVAGAAVQNFVPIPITDIIVLFGAFIMAASHESGIGVFMAAWLGNAGFAVIMYGVARYYRSRNAEPRIVRWILRGDKRAERKWAFMPVFLSCFLPVRPLLPVLAGLGTVPFWRLMLPIGVAAGLWYGGVVIVGTASGHNFGAVLRAFDEYRLHFAIAGAVLTALVLLWWIVRRRRRRAST